MLWIKEMEMVEAVDSLKTSQSSGGRRFQLFQTLDAKVASAHEKDLMNSYFKMKVSLEEHKAHMETDFSVEDRLRS